MDGMRHQGKTQISYCLAKVSMLNKYCSAAPTKMDLLGFIIWICTEVPVALTRDILAVIFGVPLILAELTRIVFDIPKAQPGEELYLKDSKNVLSVSRQIIFVLLSLSPLWWLIWGYRLLMITLLNLLRILPIQWGLWPKQQSLSYTGDKSKSAERVNYFVNGICVDENWLQLNCKTLEDFLGERVQGIHNQSYGLIVDLVECLLQRDLRFYTESVMQAAERVRESLLQGRKVRLIGHSQGGIIVSLVVDYIVYYYPDLTQNLEVYTFASAADKYCRPPYPIVMKHYGNQFDLVAWLGVLGCRQFYTKIVHPLWALYGDYADIDEDPRYYGEVFYRPGGFGHLLSTNYKFNHPSMYKPLCGPASQPSPF